MPSTADIHHLARLRVVEVFPDVLDEEIAP